MSGTDAGPIGQGADGDGARGASGRRRKGAGARKAPANADAKSVRVHYRFGREVAERLGVHCTMAHRRNNESAVVEEILLRYLKESGKGRELFDQRTSRAGGVVLPDTGEDRQSETAA